MWLCRESSTRSLRACTCHTSPYLDDGQVHFYICWIYSVHCTARARCGINLCWFVFSFRVSFLGKWEICYIDFGPFLKRIIARLIEMTRAISMFGFRKKRDAYDCFSIFTVIFVYKLPILRIRHDVNHNGIGIL